MIQFLQNITRGCAFLVVFTTILSAQPLEIAPGVKHYSYTIAEEPWTMDILEIEWPQPDLHLRTAIANDTIEGSQVEPTTSLAAEYDSTGHWVIAAVNGDFFHINRSGLPVNLHLQRGELATNPIPRDAVAFTPDDRILFADFHIGGYIRVAKGQRYPLSGVNRERWNDELIMYNRYHGRSTRTNSYGTELRVIPIDEWQVNQPFRVLVRAREIGKGDMPIPEHGAILSGHHVASIFLNNNIDIGDTLTVEIDVGPYDEPVTEAIGGGPMIIRNGKVIEPDEERHPRTGIGINRDTSKVYLFTVDGRSDKSAGMTLHEMGQFVKREFNMWNALNLDGGGSTTMVIWNTIVNSPSDASGERPVGNALLLVSTAPDSVLRPYPKSPDQ